MTVMENLICAIFEQAIKDYKFLKAKNLKQAIGSGGGSGVYSIRDIEAFFNSKWCTHLLELIGSGLSGKDVLSKVQKQCA